MSVVDRFKAWIARRLGAGSGGYLGYEMGRQNRTDPGFVPPTVGPNALADQTLGLVVRRSRYLNDAHPIIANAQQIIVNNTAGCGFYPEPNTGYKELDKQIRAVWFRMEGACDPGREQSIYENQRLFVKEVTAAGEVTSYIGMGKPWRRYPAAPTIELIEQERIDLGLNSGAVPATGLAPGHEVRQGVEFDADGRRVAYHVLNRHPADGQFAFAVPVINGPGMKRYSAMDATLAFVPRRRGQVRGVPWMVSVGETVRMEHGLHEAFVMQARIMACLSTFIQTPNAGAKLLKARADGAVLTDFDGNPITMLEPGIIGILGPEDKVNTTVPNAPSPTMAMAEEIVLRRIAAGLNISYSDLSRDYSKSTFSSERASTLSDRKGYRPLQKFAWQNHTRPYYERLIDWGILTGEIKLTDEMAKAFTENPQLLYQCSVIFEGWQWVNPQQEAQAAEIELGMGITSVPWLCAQQGRHWQDVVDEQLQYEAYEQAERRRLGLSPRQAAPVRPAVPGDEKPEPGQGEDNRDDQDAPASRRGLKIGGARA